MSNIKMYGNKGINRMSLNVNYTSLYQKGIDNSVLNSRNDKNFSQDVPFDFKQVAYKIGKASKNPEKLNPYYTISAIFDCTKVFYSISSALSMGFSDITEKCGIMREQFKRYDTATDIQNLLENLFLK